MGNWKIYQISWCRFVDTSKFHITKVINVYACFHATTSIMAIISPILMHERRFPFIMYVPFGINETNIGFAAVYLYQVMTSVYAGGLKIAVNMCLFGIFVCVTFCLSLLSSRISRLGYRSGYNEEWAESPRSKKNFYREICELIELHLKIDRLMIWKWFTFSILL